MKVPLKEVLAKATQRPLIISEVTRFSIIGRGATHVALVHTPNSIAGYPAAVSYEEAEANAALLCHSANVIEELVEALRTCRERRCGYAGLDMAMSYNPRLVEEALAKAENVEVE